MAKEITKKMVEEVVDGYQLMYDKAMVLVERDMKDVEVVSGMVAIDRGYKSTKISLAEYKRRMFDHHITPMLELLLNSVDSFED